VARGRGAAAGRQRPPHAGGLLLAGQGRARRLTRPTSDVGPHSGGGQLEADGGGVRMALPYSLGRRAPLPVPSAMSCPPADGRWYSVEAGAEAGPPSSPTAGWREAEDESRLASTIHSPHAGVSSTTTGACPLSSVATTARSKGISEAESRAPPAAACCLARDFGATLLCV
jgi:hypothetical protein